MSSRRDKNNVQDEFKKVASIEFVLEHEWMIVKTMKHTRGRTNKEPIKAQVMSEVQGEIEKNKQKKAESWKKAAEGTGRHGGESDNSLKMFLLSNKTELNGRLSWWRLGSGRHNAMIYILGEKFQQSPVSSIRCLPLIRSSTSWTAGSASLPQ